MEAHRKEGKGIAQREARTSPKNFLKKFEKRGWQTQDDVV